MNYESLLTDLGGETGLNLASATQSGSCTIAFETGSGNMPLHVTLEASDHNGEPQRFLHLHAVIGTAPAMGAEALFMRLLQLHVLGIATAQGMFGYDPALRNILFFQGISLASLSQPDTLKIIEEFVNQAERWRNHLPELVSSETFSASLPHFLMQV